MRHRRVSIVGIGDDGCVGLSSRAMNAIASAQVLVGAARHLAFFPDFPGKQLPLQSALQDGLEALIQLAQEDTVCILASGDPLFYGIGARVIEALGADNVEVIVQPSAMQLAFARAGLPWEDAAFISLHGRPLQGFLTRLKRVKKVAVFTDATNTPQRIAAYMLRGGAVFWEAWVCENLNGPGERTRHFALTELMQVTEVAPLNVLLLQRTNAAFRPLEAIPFLHEDSFARRAPYKGCITKRETRLVSLASLHIGPSDTVWDIGAGSGSIAIEAALLAPGGHVYAVELDEVAVGLCEENMRLHQVDNLSVVHGRAPEALDTLESPNAVFIGGSQGNMGAIIETAWRRLVPGGCLVANIITLENIHAAHAALRRCHALPEVTLLQVSRAKPRAGALRYEAFNPIHIFSARKSNGAPQEEGP